MKEEQLFKIENASNDLFFKALRTVPIVPKYADLEFRAEGIAEPWAIKDEAEKLRYRELCKSKGIIPYSCAVFRADTGTFRPTTFELDSNSLKDFIEGGKIHRIQFKTSSPMGARNFPLFLKYIDSLSGNNYQLAEGSLALTTYHLTRYNQGDYADTKLNLNENRSITLGIGHEIDKKQIALLKKWFSEMKKKAKA